MPHPLVEKIVKEGLPSVKVGMLSPELRRRLMTEAGNVLLHGDRYAESAEAFLLAGNREALRDHGHWFMDQQRYGVAALFLRHVAPREDLEELARECLRRGETAAAKAIYDSLGDPQMVAFIQENF